MYLAVIDFIRENLSWILSIAAAIAAIIFAIIKKRPVANFWDRELIDLIMLLPTFICEAEIKFQRGEEKLAFVKSKIESYLKCIIVGENARLDYEAALSLLMSQVEQILDTPRKKGNIVYGEKKS